MFDSHEVVKLDRAEKLLAASEMKVCAGMPSPRLLLAVSGLGSSAKGSWM